MTDEIASLTDFLAAFDKARGHIKTSEREFLLAARETLTVFVRLGEQTGTEALGLPLHILRIMVATLDFLITLIPENAPEEQLLAAKRVAIEQLIGVLDGEALRAVKSAESQADLAKVEAIQGLIKYFQAELAALSDDSAAAKQRRQRITRIDVE